MQSAALTVCTFHIDQEEERALLLSTMDTTAVGFLLVIANGRVTHCAKLFII